MTTPVEPPVLTAEHQAIADNLYSRIEQYQQDHYFPAAGWPRSSLAYDVRSSLSKADGSAPSDHTHSTSDVDGLDEYVGEKLSGFSPTTHRHSFSTIDGVSVAPTPNTGVLRDGQGRVEVLDPTTPSHATPRRYVDQELAKKPNTVHNHVISDVGGLQSILDSKASRGHLHSIDDVAGLRNALSSSTGGGSVDPEVLLNKADLVNGTVPVSQLPQLPITKINSLATELADRPKMVDGKIPRSLFPVITQSDISGLPEFINSQSNNAKLVDGVVPAANLPRSAFQGVLQVGSQAEMTSLTSYQVSDGDTVVVTSGTGQGTYTLLGPPSATGSWVKHTFNESVKSVNGKTGTVTLTASDVGARGSGSVPLADVTGLQTLLDSKLSSSALDTALVSYAKSSEVAGLRTDLSTQNYSYPTVDYVSTSRITSLSGQQNIDGVLVSVGKRVLLTNQSSSSQNGIWVVSTTAWYRDSTMPESSVVPRGALVTVLGGSANANTLWRMSNSSSSRVGTDSQNWSLALTAGGGGIDFTAGNGLQLVGSTLSVKAGSNITVNASGISLDTTGLMRKFSGDVPAGSAVATVTHSLNTRDVYVSIYEVATGDQVLAGVSITSVNTVAIEFGTAPASGQYRAVVFG